MTHPDDLGRKIDSGHAQSQPSDGSLLDDTRLIRKDGSVFQAALTAATAIGDPSGEVGYVVRMVEDVTGRRELEERVRQTEKLESVGRLSAGIAHNFNNALAVMAGHAELAALELERDHPIQEGLDQIRRVADRSGAMVEELLTFSQKDIIHLSRCDLNGIVQSTAKLLTPLLGDGIEMDLQLKPGLDGIRADPVQLEHIITNLVFNARDAMRARGLVTIETGHVELDATAVAAHPPAKPGRHVMLAVADTGQGMDAETKRRIFDPFFTTKEQGDGTGLGLAIVHGAVGHSGGFVSVKSQPNAGSRFVLHWPSLGPRAEDEVHAHGPNA